jgi:hypothetical protein
VADLALDYAEETLDFLGLGRIAGKGTGAGLGTERAEFFDSARGEGNLDAFAREQPRQRCAQSFAGADDQGNLVFWNFHERSPEKTGTWYLGAQSRKATRKRRGKARDRTFWPRFARIHWRRMSLQRK